MKKTIEDLKKPIEEWDSQQRFEVIYFLAAIALIIVGLNGNTPLVIVGGSIFLLIFLRRFYSSRK